MFLTRKVEKLNSLLLYVPRYLVPKLIYNWANNLSCFRHCFCEKIWQKKIIGIANNRLPIFFYLLYYMYKLIYIKFITLNVNT